MVNESNINEQEDLLKDSEKQQKKLKRKLKAKDLVIVVLIIVILLLLFLRSCSAPPKTEAPKIQTGTLIEKEEVKVQPVEKGRIFVPAILDFTVSKSEPYVTLFSPEENAGNYLLKYQFVNSETGEVIYESDYLEGGFKYSVDFGSLLEVGEYAVTVNLTSKDAVTFEDKNGAISQIKVTVNA